MGGKVKSVPLDSPEKVDHKALKENVDLEDLKESKENRVPKETSDRQEIRGGLERTALKVLLDSQANLDRQERRVIKGQGVSLV